MDILPVFYLECLKTQCSFNLLHVLVDCVFQCLLCTSTLHPREETKERVQNGSRQPNVKLEQKKKETKGKIKKITMFYKMCESPLYINNVLILHITSLVLIPQ